MLVYQRVQPSSNGIHLCKIKIDGFTINKDSQQPSTTNRFGKSYLSIHQLPPCWAGGLEIETNKGGVNRLEKLGTWKV